MPSSIKDLQRLVNGVSLIAKEYLNHTQPESLIYSSLKRATDLVGFTRGRVHDQVPHRPPRSKETVVYFTQQQEAPAAPEVNDGGAGASNVGGGEHETERIHNEKIEEIVCNPVTETLTAVTTTAEVTAASVTETSTAATATAEVTAAYVTETSTAATATAEVTAASTKIPVEEDRKLENVRNETVSIAVPLKRRRPRERKVPATPFTRALGFAGLGAGLAWGTLQESTKRLVYGTPKSQDNQSALSPFLSEQNAERLALALCRMRGAALKLGQMLSIQDASLVPAPILAALDIVRQGADVMPKSQLNQVLDAELGTNWTSKLRSFDYEPVAAASIGQVHRAVTKDGVEVAMKIQYPGVADSIGSDIDNVKLLLDYTNLIPKGLYLDSAIKVAKEELSRECNYEIEAANQKRFRELLSDREGIYVPRVIDDICSKRVITTEFVSGVPIDKVSLLSQKTRDYVGTKLLELTLMELFVFRFMQTDPNWSNFLYDEATNMINLIDFGAARDFPKTFVDDYLRMVMACANCDRDAVLEMSRRLGFLTGMESEIMLETHVQAGFVVGVPFSRPGGYDFRASHITQSVSNLGATMLKHRLTPPPDEAYSLHRKLSGAFLACMKIGAVVPCRDLLLEVYQKYQFDDNEGTKVHSSDSDSSSNSNSDSI